MDELWPDEEWGPAHHLVGRGISTVRSLPLEAVHFVEPLRDGVRRLRGQDLLDSSRLRRALTLHALPRNRVDLMVVLLDGDGDKTRYTALTRSLSAPPTPIPVVFAVPEPEFEAWLLGDLDALRTCSDREVPRNLAPPETLAPRVAKSRFGIWERAAEDPATARSNLCRELRIDQVAASCPTFARFLKDLGSP